MTTKSISKEEIHNYWETMRVAMFDTRLRGVAPSLLWYLSVNSYSTIWFTQANLAKQLGLERRAIMRATASLEENEYIDVDRPPRGSHKTLKITLKERYKAPTKLIIAFSKSSKNQSSSCPLEVHDMSVSGTRGVEEVEPVMSVSGTHNGDNGNYSNGFEKQHLPMGNENGSLVKQMGPANKNLVNIIGLSTHQLQETLETLARAGIHANSQDIDLQVTRCNDYYSSKQDYNLGMLLAWVKNPRNYQSKNKTSLILG